MSRNRDDDFDEEDEANEEVEVAKGKEKAVVKADDSELKVLQLKSQVYDWLIRLNNAQEQITQCKEAIDILNKQIVDLQQK